MKRVVTMFVSFLLLLTCVNPGVSLAAINEADLDAFSKAEGFKDAKEFKVYFNDYFYEHDLDSLSTVDELKTVLGERLNEENVQEIVIDYGFNDREELMDTLMEFDEIVEGETIEETFIYVNALKGVLTYYVDELTPVTDENLNELLKEYELTLDELKQLLANNDDSLDNYKYIEDLDAAVYHYLYSEDLPEGLPEIGLTDEEMERLLKHILSIDLEDPALEQRMLAIEERLKSLPDFDSASDLTQAQIKEIASIFTEVLDILQLKASYYLVKDSEKKAITLNELLVLETTNGADLLIELYNTQGEFLADLVITAENFGSDLIDEEIVKVTQPITQPVKNPPKKVERTIKGGKMPNTAGNYAEGILAGLLLIGAGTGLLIRRKRNAA